jgi:hypothetical protein
MLTPEQNKWIDDLTDGASLEDNSLQAIVAFGGPLPDFTMVCYWAGMTPAEARAVLVRAYNTFKARKG